MFYLQVFKELVELIRVVISSFAWNRAFDDCVAVANQVVAEVTIPVAWASGEELVGRVCRRNVFDDRRREYRLGGRGGGGGCCGGGRHGRRRCSSVKMVIDGLNSDHIIKSLYIGYILIPSCC